MQFEYAWNWLACDIVFEHFDASTLQPWMAASLALLVFRLSADRPKLGDADAAIASPARDPFIVGMTVSVFDLPTAKVLVMVQTVVP
jgi:hypothetical protein